MVPLPEDAIFTPSVGLLIRVCRPSRERLRLRSLDAKLVEPMGLRRLTPDDAPGPIGAKPGIVLLKPGAEQCFVATPPDGVTTAHVRDTISEEFALSLGQLFTVHVPCRPVRDLLVQGRLASSVLGGLPDGLAGCRLVFVDPRLLGKSIVCLALPPIPFTVTGVLGLLRIPRPNHLEFQFEGCDGIVGNSEAFLPRHSALITFSVSEAALFHACKGEETELGHSDLPDASSFPSSTDGPGVHGPPCRPPVTSPASPDQPADSPHPVVALADAAILPDAASLEDLLLNASSSYADARRIGSMWNRESTRDALDQCPPGDTPARPCESGSPASSRIELCRDPLPDDSSVCITEGILPVPAADEQRQQSTSGLPFEEGGEEEEAVSSSVHPEDPSPRHEEDSSSGEGEWRLPVRVLNFQRRQTFDYILTAPGETIHDILIRAEVFLKPRGNFFTLVSPQHQPCGDCLTLLCFPRWWASQDILAFTIADGQRPGDPFLQVTRPGDTMEDVLPLSAQENREMVDTYVAGADDTSLFPKQEDLLFLQRSGLPTPTFATVSEIITDSELDTPESMLPQPEIAPLTRFLLLGTGFDQAVVDLQPGPVLPEVAAVTRIPQDEIVHWVQPGLFEEAAVQGRAFHRAIGFRDRRMFPVGDHCVIFIDPRTLGRPLCFRRCRWAPMNPMTPERLTPDSTAQVSDHEMQVAVRHQLPLLGPAVHGASRTGMRTKAAEIQASTSRPLDVLAAEGKFPPFAMVSRAGLCRRPAAILLLVQRPPPFILSCQTPVGPLSPRAQPG